MQSRSINNPKLESSRIIEWFSFECRKVIGFAFTTLRDWFKKLAPLFHPIRSKTKTNRDSLVHILQRFASATCNCFAFWLVHLIICVLCDWLEWLLWFWFYDTQMKTALSSHLDWSSLVNNRYWIICISGHMSTIWNTQGGVHFSEAYKIACIYKVTEQFISQSTFTYRPIGNFSFLQNNWGAHCADLLSHVPYTDP